MKKILIFALCFLICGCQTNYFENFYNDEEQEIDTYIPRKYNEDVKIIDTMDLTNTLKRYEKDYIILGTSAFNGHWCSRSLAVDVAKDKGATLVIIGTKPTGSQTQTVSVEMPRSNTIYHSGEVSKNQYSYGDIQTSNGGWVDYNSSTNTSTSYRGETTYYTTKTIYNKIQNYYFDQVAFFMAKKRQAGGNNNE